MIKRVTTVGENDRVRPRGLELRLLFRPVRLTRIELIFGESAHAGTQEFVLRCGMISVVCGNATRLDLAEVVDGPSGIWRAPTARTRLRSSYDPWAV